MDDDYDNYVPQISTMDWQNLGDTHGGVVGGGGGQGPMGSGQMSAGDGFSLYTDNGAVAMQQGGQMAQQYQQQTGRGGPAAGAIGAFPGMSIQQQPTAQQQGGYTAIGPVDYEGSPMGGGAQSYQQQQFVAAHQQMLQHRQQQMIAAAAAYGGGGGAPIPPAGYMNMMVGPTAAGKPTSSTGAQQQQGAPKSKGSKRGKKAEAAAAAQNVPNQSAEQSAAAQQKLPPGSSGPGQQQFPMGQMGYYYKGLGPGPSGHPMMMMASPAGQPTAGKWAYQGQQPPQEEQQTTVQLQYGSAAAQAGMQQMPPSQPYGAPIGQQTYQQGYHPSAQQPSQQQQQKLPSAQIQQEQQKGGGGVQQQQYGGMGQPQQPQPQQQQQQQAGYYGQQQQQYAHQLQQQQQQQAVSGPYSAMGMAQHAPAGPSSAATVGGGNYAGAMPFPGGPAAAAGYSQAAMAAVLQRQAYYAQQQQMMGSAAAVSGAAPVGPAGPAAAYYPQQHYAMNPYMAHQQQIYRELYECDQQLSNLMPQAQQSPEVAMRIEKLQMHRNNLHGQMMQLQQQAAAAMMAGGGGHPAGGGMVAQLSTGGISRENAIAGGTNAAAPMQMQSQYPIANQQQPNSYPPPPAPGQQQQHSQANIPAQQKMPSNNSSHNQPQMPPPPSPFGGVGPPANVVVSSAPHYGPPPPGFHSPLSGNAAGVQQQQAAPPPPQQQQQAQGQQQPQYAQHHLASPSVAVMSASNQVQVNIRPEVPGRTLISVYHSQDIPSAIPPPAVVSSAAIPPAHQQQQYGIHHAQMGQHPAEPNGSQLKDSIPPEPMPPSIAQEQKRRQLQQQMQQQEQLEREREENESMSNSGSIRPRQHSHSAYSHHHQHQQQQMGVPPPFSLLHTTQTTIASSALDREEEAQRKEEQQQKQEELLAKREQRRSQTPSFVLSPAAHPPAAGSPPLTATSTMPVHLRSPRQMASAHCLKSFSIARVDEPTALTVAQIQPTAKPAFEPEMTQPLSPILPTATAMDVEEERKIREDGEKPEGKVLEGGTKEEPMTEDEQPSEIAEMLMAEQEEKGSCLTAKEPLVQEEEEEKVCPSALHLLDEKEQQQIRLAETDGMEEETLTPCTSQLQLESKADDKESADDSNWPGTCSTKETTPLELDDSSPFAFKMTDAIVTRKSSGTLPSGAFSKVGGSSRSRNRKKRHALDWNRDEDDDYVGSKKKKKTMRSELEESLANEVGFDEDFLLEKRRSSRKKTTGKKTKYGENTDEEEEELGKGQKRKATKKEQQSAATKATASKTKQEEEEETLLQTTQVEYIEERVVEKILGVRLAKRKLVKRKRTNERTEKDGGEEANAGKDDVLEIEPEKEMVASEEKEEGEIEEDEEAAAIESIGKAKQKREEELEENLVADKTKSRVEELGKEANAEEGEKTKKEDKKGEDKMEDQDKEEDEKEEEEIVEQEVEELYVKFKGYSYLHCEWKTVEELEQLGDKRVLGKLTRWKQKYSDSVIIVAGEQDEHEYFNEDFTVVSRVLDETHDEQENQHYVFVKWKALSYEDCTWELVQDVPEQRLEEFRQRNKFDQCKGKEQPRLSLVEWSSRLAIAKDRQYKNDNVLREYQHEGVNWLLWTWTNGQNCILADEMGLGKTVQTIVFFQSLYDIGIHGPFLVVVPLSTLGNWEREFDNWTNINAIVYHGGAISRKVIQDYEFYYKKTDRKKLIPKFDALITTYEVVVQEVEVLRKINFRVCVIDEAHRIKNRNCKLLQSGLLPLKMEHRVLLTGTPLQNNIQELFSLLNFLEPEQFANSEAFLQQFGQCQTDDQVQKLQDILKPMMLRRLKEDVEKELQPKEETIVEVQLSNIQKKYYRALLEKNFTHLMKGITPSQINTMMELRKCCNHPYLIDGAEERILLELKESHPEKTDEELQSLCLISSSGKLVLIDKLLPKLHADGHKVLIFSQMVRVLDLLEEYLNIKGYPFERIDGNIRGNERQAAIDRFSRPNNNDRFVFLLCTRAGGLGINLTAADTVIIFDSDWNPQNDLQAQARCHRIGQTKPVKIYRLITSNTYEREMFDKASLKLGLDKAVLQSMLHRDSSQQMSRQEVEDLLRKGAYGAIMDEDNEGTKFSEEDIDTILERRTQTIRLEPGVKGSTFAKASFTTSHNRDDIDIQDPDFWAKWAKKAKINVDPAQDESTGQHLIVHEPRARKKRFENDNFKGNSESGDEAPTEEEERQSTPGGSRIAEGVKNRSAKRRRRGGAAGATGTEEDDDYAYKPDELAFSKSIYFKVEKLLAQWGWGRWATMKQFSELNENELEHISRTLLLHFIRVFSGDKKIREYVWTLISPASAPSSHRKPSATETMPNLPAKTEEKGKKGSAANASAKAGAQPPAADADPSESVSFLHQGWAALPEFNPPFICMDNTFKRHLIRRNPKLVNRIHQLHFLHAHILKKLPPSPPSPVAADGKMTESTSTADEQKQPQMNVEMNMELPDNLDAWLIVPSWDRACDEAMLIGVYKHGMENWEQIRADQKLCFAEKNIQLPSTGDLHNRFKYLISVLQRQHAEMQSAQTGQPKQELKWTKVEESDFMRILRNYGVKDDTNSENVINWNRFRELSICLHKKTDAEMLEMLYCVLAMCTKEQGGALSSMDERRAERVDPIAAKAAEKLMNRLHLMRKVHAIITMGIQHIRGMLKMVALDVMPKGWTEAHDEHLLIVVDKFGLEDIHGKVKLLPKLFESQVGPVDESTLLRRVVEICVTLETGQWKGPATTEMLEDEPVGGHQQQQPSTSGLAGKGTPKSSGNAGGGRKKPESTRKGGGNSSGGQNQPPSSVTSSAAGGTGSAKGPAAASGLLAGFGGSNSISATKGQQSAISYNDQQMLLKMMEQMSNPNYLLSLMSLMNPVVAGSSSSAASTSGSLSTAALQQQFQQQLQTLAALTAFGSGTATPMDLNSLFSSLTASIASLAGLGTSGTGAINTAYSTPKQQQQQGATGGSADVLNLSKRAAAGQSLQQKPAVSTKAAATASSALLSTPTTASGTSGCSSSAPIKSSAVAQPSTTPAALTGANACLSTGLSTSAINKLSQMSVPELLAYSNLAQETRIPVVHLENGQKLEAEKAPMLKNLDQWLKANPKYNVDLLSLATSHPSLFSGAAMSATTSNMNRMPSTPSTQRGMATTTSSATATHQQQQRALQTTPSSAKEKATATGTTSVVGASPISSLSTQHLVEQAKKTSVVMPTASASTSNSAAMAKDANSLTSALSSLFGMSDFQQSAASAGTSAAAQQQANAAALNQFIASLSPASVPQSANQLQQSTVAALAAAAAGCSTSSQSTASAGGATAASLKNLEQQMLLLQQASLLGSTAGTAASLNPYAALLYQNTSDLFGLKNTTSSSSSSTTALGSQSSAAAAFNAMADPSAAAAAAALAQAALGGFPSSSGSSSNNAAADLNSALTSELYLAAMASSLQPFLGGCNSGGTKSGGAGSATTLSSLQNATSSLYGASGLSGATLEQLLAAAGITSIASGNSIMPSTAGHAHVMSSSQPQKRATAASPATHTKVSLSGARTKPRSATASHLQPQQQFTSILPSSSVSAKLDNKKSNQLSIGGCPSVSGKGLKLNAVLEKLASAGGGGGGVVAQTSSSPAEIKEQKPPAVEELQQKETIIGSMSSASAGDDTPANGARENSSPTAEGDIEAKEKEETK